MDMKEENSYYTLHKINFLSLKLNRKCLLKEKNDIVVWGRKYLEIYYPNEIWMDII